MKSFGPAVLGMWLLVSAIALCVERPSGDQILAHAKSLYSKEGPTVALPEYENALAAYRGEGNQLGEAVTLGLIGNCYKKLGKYPKALEMLNTALSMKRALHARLEEGKTLNHLGLVYWEQGDYPQAIEVFNESIAVAIEVKDVQLHASALNNLSLVFDELGDYKRSIEQYKKALELQRSVNYEPGESDALGNLGGAYLSLGRFSEAESYYREALEISRRLELKDSQTLDLGNIALCQFEKGRTQEALGTFDQALAIAKAAGLFKDEADWNRDKASALLRIGQFDNALRALAKAELSYASAGLKREQSETLLDIGSAYVQVGDKANAEANIRRATHIAKSIGYTRGSILDELALADVLIRSGELQLATNAATSALESARQKDQADAEVQSLLLLAAISRDRRRITSAEMLVNEARKKAHAHELKVLEAEALDLAAELDLRAHHPADALSKLDSAKTTAGETGDVDLLWRTEFHRGMALEPLQRNDEAVSEYWAAIRTIEDVRTSISERRFRTGYFQDKQRVYIALIALLLRMGKDGEAFGVSERLREFSFLQIWGEPSGQPNPKIAEARARIRRLQELLDRENSKAVNQQRSENLREYSDELITAQRQLQALLEDSGAAFVPQLATAGLSEKIEMRLPAHAALIEYVVDENQLLTFVLTRSGLHALKSATPERQLKAKIDLLRDLIADEKSDAWKKPAASLRNILVTPLESKNFLAGIDRLIIVPHSIVNALPFAVLPAQANRNGSFLVQQYELGELPSGSWLLNAPRIKNSGPATMLAVAPANSRLKYAIPEATEIAHLFAPLSTTLIGSHATETRFKQASGSYDILHVATHGFFNHTNPLFSGLQLESDRENDGRLEVHEVMSLHLKSRLVTLSACDTALGGGDFSEIPAGDEFVGLSRAFLEAGSAAVLASLWKVDDHSTPVIMGRLYRAMKTREGMAALAKAQREMIEDPEHHHPFYWASFVFIGGELNKTQLLAEKQ